MGDVIALPVPERSCFVCVHAAFGSAIGTFCTQFNETIWSEKAAAEDCPMYEPE